MPLYSAFRYKAATWGVTGANHPVIVETGDRDATTDGFVSNRLPIEAISLRPIENRDSTPGGELYWATIKSFKKRLYGRVGEAEFIRQTVAALDKIPGVHARISFDDVYRAGGQA